MSTVEHNCITSANAFVGLITSVSMSYLVTWDFERFEETPDNKLAISMKVNAGVIWPTLLIWVLFNVFARAIAHKSTVFRALKLDSLINLFILLIPQILFTSVGAKYTSRLNLSPEQRSKRAFEMTLAWLVPMLTFLVLEFPPLAEMFCKRIIHPLENLFPSRAAHAVV